jgi:flavin-dependent dehydrogenase
MSEMKKYDVIVIGSGMAGNLFAYLTASARLSVLLIEKNNTPKAHARSIGLNPACWQVWQRLKFTDEFKALPHTLLKSIEISFAGHSPTSFPVDPDRPEIRCLGKENLKIWLREKAIAAGAEYLPGVECKEVDFARRLMTDVGEFHSKVLIGADGRNSWLARMANFPLKKINRHKTIWQTNIPAPGKENTAHYKFFKEGYLELTPPADGATDVYMILREKCQQTPQRIMNDFFPGHEHLSWHSFPHARNNPAAVAKNNILLLGDAGKVLEPFTGQGIRLALRSAEIAARLVIETRLKGGWNYLDDRYNYAHAGLCQNLSFRNRLADFLVKYPVIGARAVKYAARHRGIAQNYLPYFSGLKDIDG